ncbi:DUF1128 domain-containing protein [Alkalihalophilus sp. As8PL]|jgi:uncharacterized protein YfkK (UPF0435 family)|uniref:UPF0435 protein AB3N04_18385 n=2 Tax=Alkalihalophilus TaxID=2893060 RepID=A0AB39BS46_9BACI|nr:MULTISPECIES: DUF1128 domain-containing protein [Bacillaceae]KMJ55610.1 hypothetical protein AB685_26350 [Bacillus sp. LL01]MDV2685397.1 DUF1128 domain-containing protein [Alkalihalophilus lindianensis]
MDLSTTSRDNIEFMIEEIKRKLQIVNAGALNAKSFDTDQYEDLRDIYEMIIKKDSFSVSELDAIVSELGKMRKR